MGDHTALPKWPRASKCRYASFASANENVRSITGRKVHRDRPVHALEIVAAADADRAERNTAAGQQ